jgi:hypothetical protein
VTRLDFRDQMTFTDLQPILSYVLSEPVVLQSLTLSRLTQLTQALKDELARRGEINITVRKGLFIARPKRRRGRASSDRHPSKETSGKKAHS